MFFSKRKADPAWPSVPPSLNHDSLELNDGKGRFHIPTRDTAGDITPYLGLRARLSQIWINRWTVLLLLVLVRVLILIAGLVDNIGDAKIKALSACTKVEDIGSAMASMPHYLSVGVNRVAAKSITEAVQAMVSVLDLMMEGVEGLILFILNFIVGTYVCLTAAFVHGGLDVGIGAANAVTKVINEAVGSITDGIVSDIAGVTKLLNDARDALSTINLFGKTINLPTINIDGRINDLRNIKVDDKDFVSSLVKINNTIPTYDQAVNFTANAISIPFNLIRDALNQTYGNYKFDDSVFPVAQKEALSFCSNNSKINDFFESLYQLAAKAKIAFIVVILVLAILAMILMGYLEIRKWRRQQRRATVLSQHGYDTNDVAYLITRPVTSTVGLKLASRFKGKRQLLMRWAIAYGTSLPALFVLSLAIAGFFSCFCQFILMRQIQNEAPALTQQVGNFAGDVVTTLENVSQKWAVDANGVLTSFTDEVNNDVLGYVTNATQAVNNTLNIFQTEINNGISAVFGGTVLENTVRNVVRCLIGLKVEAVEKGLTWVHDHARVSLPLFPNDTFSLGAQKSISGDSDLTSFLASPSSVTTDEITDAVNHVINYLHNNIIQEALISTGLLLVYVIVVLIGVVRAALGMATPGNNRGDGGQRFYTGDGRAPMSPRRGVSDASSARFPRFGVDAAESAAAEDRVAAAARDEKLAYADKVSGGRGLRSPGHWRTSSYGKVEDARR